MSQNIGTLITSSIRPVDSNDRIATAYAYEIKGGLHSVSSVIDRDNIIEERREWGMLTYVQSQNKTYQLKYNLFSTNINDNLNWTEFSGSGSGGGEWIDSVLQFLGVEPASPTDGDRYILSSSPSGVNWSSLSAGLVVQWNSTLSQWVSTTPTDGMSVRVDNEDNSIYRYETYGGSSPPANQSPPPKTNHLSPSPDTDNDAYALQATAHLSQSEPYPLLLPNLH